MRTAHGFARLVGFSDGVVAIAITLLILPLVDAASGYRGDVGAFFNDHLGQFLVFLLSFVVIGDFWIVHHRLFERLDGYNTPLLWTNLLWLLSIVFLPFPTALLAGSHSGDRAVYALYVGTMVVTTTASLLLRAIAVRSPELQADGAGGMLRLTPAVLPLLLMVAAFALAVWVPAIGLWSLTLLALARPIEALTHSRNRKAKP